MSAQTTVLIVDDEPRSLEAIKRVLADEFEVICASNAAQAEAVLSGEMVQIILCDQRMPGEGGVDFLKRARELWPDTIRIIISGYSDSEDVIAGVNLAGIFQYITKPWHPENLLEIIREDYVRTARAKGLTSSTASFTRRAARSRRPSRWDAARRATTFPS